MRYTASRGGRILKKSKWLRGALIAVGALAGYVGYQGVRAFAHLRQTSILVKKAQSFPSEYTVGEGRPLTYVSLGDSTVFGVGVDRVEETLPRLIASHLAAEARTVEVHNFGVSGAVTSDVLTSQIPKLPEGEIDLATISISGNDATHGTDLAEFKRDLAGVLNALKARNVKAVVLTTTPNFKTAMALPFPVRQVVTARAQTLSEAIEAVARRYPLVQIADLFREGTLGPNDYAPDEFHPSAKGYRVWAAIFERAVDRAHLFKGEQAP